MKCFSIGLILIFLISCLKLKGQQHKIFIESINNAISYLHNQPYEYDFVFLYSYLKNKYPEIIKEASSVWVNAQLSASTEVELLFTKLRNPNFQLTDNMLMQVLNMRDTDAMTIRALYCNQFELGDDYIDLLKNEAGIGNYQASHALLALIWLRQNGCLKNINLSLVENLIIEANWTNIKVAEDWTDLKIESIAFLQEYGVEMEIKLIEGLLKQQNPDGGFPMKPDTLQSHTHTTILAIWALLPYCTSN